MAKKIIEQYNVSKLDIINAETSLPFRELKGATIPVKGVAIIEEDDGDEVTQYGYLFANDGTVYGGNSETIRRALSSLIDLMDDDPEKEYAASVIGRPSSSGREFLTLHISELE